LDSPKPRCRSTRISTLKTLPQASITAAATTTRQPGPNGADLATTVTITNTSAAPTVGFFLRADVRRGTATGTELAGDNELQSSIWNDNDVTLWPGESETLTSTYNSGDLQGASPVIKRLRMEHAGDRRCSSGTVTCLPTCPPCVT
jgi:exo-1,4-beta-D-glucosaminidase